MKNRNIHSKTNIQDFSSRCSSHLAAVFISAPTLLSPRRWPFNGTVSGTLSRSLCRSASLSAHVIKLRTRDSSGAFTGTRTSSRAPCDPTRNFVKNIFPTRAPLTGLRPTRLNLRHFRGVTSPTETPECTTTMKPGVTGAQSLANATGPVLGWSGTGPSPRTPPSFVAPMARVISVSGSTRPAQIAPPICHLSASVSS